jgi:hypothetical protein
MDRKLSRVFITAHSLQDELIAMSARLQQLEDTAQLESFSHFESGQFYTGHHRMEVNENSLILQEQDAKGPVIDGYLSVTRNS